MPNADTAGEVVLEPEASCQNYAREGHHVPRCSYLQNMSLGVLFRQALKVPPEAGTLRCTN